MVMDELIMGKGKDMDQACKTMYENFGSPDGLIGSAQYFIQGSKNLTKEFKQSYKIPDQLSIFHYLIMDCDHSFKRNLVERDGVVFYIDHGLAFLSTKHLKEIKDGINIQLQIYQEERKLMILEKLTPSTQLNNLKKTKDDQSKFCDEHFEIEKNLEFICDPRNPKSIESVHEMHQNMFSQLPNLLGNLLTPDRLIGLQCRIHHLVKACPLPPSVNALPCPGKSDPAAPPETLVSLADTIQNTVDRLKCPPRSINLSDSEESEDDDN